MSECVKCGQLFQTEAKTGRPASYCSIGCRRSSELEISRINKRLGSLEDELFSEKRHRDRSKNVYGELQSERIAALQNAITENEPRLKQLLSAKGD
jgi:hypothetical protein